MAGVRVAHRYAGAILEVAEQGDVFDEVARDFESIERLIRASREFALFVHSPVISKQKKESVIEKLFRDRVVDLTMRFLLLLIAKDRENLLPEIVREFQKLRNERLGILDTTVHTAIQFTQREDEQLIQHLQQRTGKKVRIRYIVDASLKGGFIVQHDDTVWNGSVRHQLERLRLQFAVGTV